MTRQATIRWMRIGLVVVGLVAGVGLPFITSGASSPRYTDIEARLGYGALAAMVCGAFGALAGWAVGALVAYWMREV